MTATAATDRTKDAGARARKQPVEVSAGLVTWMIRNQVSFAFSSYQHGDLFFLGAQGNGSAVFSRARFPYAMGVAAFAQRIYLASHAQIWRLENILKPDELVNDRYDRLFVPRNGQVVGPLDVHELGVEPSGRILFANTKYSCLATPSITHSFQPVWKPKFVSKLAPEDRCHLNGVGMEEGRVRYVTCCSTSDIVDGWREHRTDGGVVIDVSDDRIVAEGLSMPHSPRVHRGGVWLLESGTGRLCRLDATTGARDHVGFYPGFLRGLAFVDNYAVVTLSLPRNGRFQGLVLDDELTKRKAVPWCGLLVIDTRNGDVVEWVRFDGDVKELFDVALIPGVRCPRGLTPGSPALQEAISMDVEGRLD
jgi:uncharacterized protein (TIGR03032 family)